MTVPIVALGDTVTVTTAAGMAEPPHAIGTVTLNSTVPGTI